MYFTRGLTRTWLGKNSNPWNQCYNLILFVLSAYWSTARSMSGQHSSLQVSMTWKKLCKRMGPANGSAWEEAGKEKMRAEVDTTPNNSSWPRNGYMKELNAKNIEEILWGKKRNQAKITYIAVLSLCCAIWREGKKHSRRIIRDPLDIHVGKERKRSKQAGRGPGKGHW